MTNLTGSRSDFGLTGRDQFTDPSSTGSGGLGSRSGLDAELLNKAGDAVITIETWDLPVIRLNSGLTSAFSPVLQRWTVTITNAGGLVNYPLSLNLSPSFLEDCGAIGTQTKSPDKSRISLANSLSLGIPRYVPTGSPGSPPWTDLVPNPVFSARLIGAGSQQTMACDYPTFLDLGTGVAPVCQTNLFMSHPENFGVAVPAGAYEICLLAFAWVP